MHTRIYRYAYRYRELDIDRDVFVYLVTMDSLTKRIYWSYTRVIENRSSTETLF